MDKYLVAESGRVRWEDPLAWWPKGVPTKQDTVHLYAGRRITLDELGAVKLTVVHGSQFDITAPARS